MTNYRFSVSVALFVLAAGEASSQTEVDLKTQAKSVDFSAATSTKPFQTGTSLPAACSLGQAFFKSNAPAGANFYACTATNTWTLQSGAVTFAPVASPFLLDSADPNLPNAQLGVAGPGITISHSPFTISFNSNALAGVYPSLAGPNAFSAGGTNTFQASATLAGLRIVGSALPSNPVAGALNVDLTGGFNWHNGSAWTTLATAATNNRTVSLPDANSTTVQPSVAPANQFATGIGANGVISYGAVTAAQLPAAELRRTCIVLIGADGGPALTTPGIQPQKSRCKFDAAATVLEVDVLSDAGASTVQVGYRRSGSTTAISPVLTPATVAGVTDKVACANTGGTAATIEGTSVTCATLSTTALAAGDWGETIGGAADSTTKRMSIAITYTVN